MNIDIFSDCVFTRGAFEYIGQQINTDKHIAVFDVGLSIDNYHNVIFDEIYSFALVLNERHHAPVAISGRVILLSKHTPLSMMIKIIKLCLAGRREFSQIILTARERLFYKYWLEGGTSAVIANKMNERVKTVSNIKQSIYRKYGTSDLYTFMLIMKISQVNENVHCRHYRVYEGGETVTHSVLSPQNTLYTVA